MHQNHMGLTLEPMTSHDQKSHVTLHFDCLDFRNAMILFMVPLVSCDTHTGTNGSHMNKSHVAPYFSHLGLRNTMMLVTMEII